MAYSVDFPELFRRQVDQVGRILDGASPGELPFYLATKVQFVINLKTAGALGITLPPSLLARADEMID